VRWLLDDEVFAASEEVAALACRLLATAWNLPLGAAAGGGDAR
jgi:hypothetical protein